MSKPIYQRGIYRLETNDGRSNNLYIRWYDPATKRTRGISARTSDPEEGQLALDAHYLKEVRGAVICSHCGQPLPTGSQSMLVTDAIADYLLEHGRHRDSADAIGQRLAHVLDYIDPSLLCSQIDERWVEGFRKWSQGQPTVQNKQRALSTTENSVLQLAAVINYMYKRGDLAKGAQFKPIPTNLLNNTPSFRLTVEQITEAFRYATDVRFPIKRQALHRFLIISVATLCRPDAAYDVGTHAHRGQWLSDARILHLNPKGRKQTKKYRASVRVPERLATLLDNMGEGFFVPVKDVKKAHQEMRKELGWPPDGEAGLKLWRRSMAQILRQRKVPAEQIELQLGHRRIDSVSDLYAAFDPAYLEDALAAMEDVMAEIEEGCPEAFRCNFDAEALRKASVEASKKRYVLRG